MQLEKAAEGRRRRSLRDLVACIEQPILLARGLLCTHVLIT
jgi:hypothetical protein